MGHAGASQPKTNEKIMMGLKLNIENNKKKRIRKDKRSDRVDRWGVPFGQMAYRQEKFVM